jgi:LuxR family maltose regulon positive regulatory protein
MGKALPGQKRAKKTYINAEIPPPASDDSRAFFHFKRPRLNSLFKEAVKYPLVLVCAGAGYGKTSAVHDFAEEYKATTVWIPLSERDNVGARFWENFTHALAQANSPLAKATVKLGFPDTPDKLSRFVHFLYDNIDKKRRIIIMDDFHVIIEPSVLRFIEECVLLKMPP